MQPHHQVGRHRNYCLLSPYHKNYQLRCAGPQPGAPPLKLLRPQARGRWGGEGGGFERLAPLPGLDTQQPFFADLLSERYGV